MTEEFDEFVQMYIDKHGGFDENPQKVDSKDFSDFIWEINLQERLSILKNEGDVKESEYKEFKDMINGSGPDKELVETILE